MDSMNNSMSQEQYIEHEVQLRVHEEKFNIFNTKVDEKLKLYDQKNESRFDHLEKRIDKVDNKLNWLIGLVFGSVLLPVALHWMKWI